MVTGSRFRLFPLAVGKVELQNVLQNIIYSYRRALGRRIEVRPFRRSLLNEILQHTVCFSEPW